MSLLDALLGFALAYSATYVLYCWVTRTHLAEIPPGPRPCGRNMTPDVPPAATRHPGMTLARFTVRPLSECKCWVPPGRARRVPALELSAPCDQRLGAYALLPFASILLPFQ